MIVAEGHHIDRLIGGVAVENRNVLVVAVEFQNRNTTVDQLLTAEDDELTPTMKLKRKFVNEKYKNLIDDMYRGAT